jgi:hypothetical protein
MKQIIKEKVAAEKKRKISERREESLKERVRYTFEN